jgi:mono/diheme cytochrome c family protein
MTHRLASAMGRVRGVGRWMLGLGAVAAVGCVGQVGDSGEGGSGTGATGGTGGTGAAGGTGLTQGNLTTDLPCDVETVMASRCWACHGQTPMVGLPALTSIAAFTAMSKTDPSVTIGARALTLMQGTATPMPPVPASPATAAEITVISNWIAAGTPSGPGCGGPICTSGTTWTRGDDGSGDMNPGEACVGCHASTLGEAPVFSIAGTVYPTVHEPDLCNGAPQSSGAHVVITGADGRTLTLSPTAAGNFYSQMTVKMPYSAKVVTAAGERAMTATQTSGDCNSCHTQNGANGAPGRIMLP